MTYSAADQAKARTELAAVRPQAPTVGRMIDDYGNLRAAVLAGVQAGARP